jgi:hypothetical protein
LLIPYASTSSFAVILGALWHGDRAASALDGFLCLGVAPLGYLLAIRVLARTNTTPKPNPIGKSIVWLTVAAIFVSVFALTIAQGIGRLA